jgi:hypothetical protein
MKYALKKVSIVLLLAAFFAFTACDGGGGSDDPETEKETETETVIGETGTDLGSVDMDGDGVSDGTAIDVDGDGTPDGVDTNGDGKIDEEYSDDFSLIDETDDGETDDEDETMTDAEAVAALASLTFTKGKLQPAFNAGTTNYLNAPVPFSSEASPAYNDTQSVDITATAANSDATITINGSSVASGSAFTMNNLDVGKNNVTIVVTTQDGTTTTTYTVEVYRAIPIFKTGAAELGGYTFEGEDGYNDTNNPSLHVSWPATRFTAIGDDSLRDEMTGLVWLKTLSTLTRNWADAITYCEDLETENATVTDWRLPNVRELRSLAHYGKTEPYTWLNGQGFSNVQASDDYWSSTTYAPYTSNVWQVHSSAGVYGGRKADNDHVWPVRSATP